MSQVATVEPFPRRNMKNPYVGPKPFEREDEYRFYGRTLESEQLVATIMGSAVTLLYAESGAGKTSLLRAKVIPMLERLDEDEQREEYKRDVLKPARVSGGTTSPGTQNVFTANVLSSIASKEELKGRTLTLAEYLRERPRPHPPMSKAPAIKPLRVLILDQFEELFTSGAEWWEHRLPFMRDLAAALDEDRRLRVVIAMREEYVASMDPYGSILPGALRTRVRLQRLREKSALEAITYPLQGTGVSFVPGAAEKLVRKLRTLPGSTNQQELLGEFVEPLHLQVVCSRIWQSLPDGEDEITEAMIGTHGDIEEALTEYYDQCIRDVAAEARVGEPSLRGWFERELITENKTRGIVFCGREYVGSLRTPVAELIAARYLIRAEFRGGGKWYELSHDRMIGPVLESGRRWRDSQAAGKIVKRLEDAARQWSLAGGHGLLGSDELAEFDTWTRSEAGRDYVMSKELKDLVQASRLAAQQRQTRRIRLYLILAVLAGMAGLLMIGGFSYFTQKAERDSMVNTLVDVAERQQRKGEHFEALLWSLMALHKFGDRDAAPPARLYRVADDASAKIGPGTWLRRNEPIEIFTTSRNGRLIVTASKGELCKWDLRVTRDVVPVCVPSPWTREAFRPILVNDDGTMVVLAISRGAFGDPFDRGISFVVLDAKLKRPTPGTGSVLVPQNAQHLLFALDRARRKLTVLDSAGKTVHEAVNIPFTFNWAVSPSGELAAVVTRTEIHAVDLRQRPPVVHLLPSPTEDVQSVRFSEDGNRLVIGREPLTSTDLVRLQLFDTRAWKEQTIAPPEGLWESPSLLINSDATRFVFGSGEWNGAAVGVMMNRDGSPAPPRISWHGSIVWSSDRGILFRAMPSEGSAEARYLWWEPFNDWYRAKWMRMDATAKLARPVGDGDGIAVIQNGAVQIRRFDDVRHRPIPSNAPAGALIERACEQLRWQPERKLVQEICK